MAELISTQALRERLVGKMMENSAKPTYLTPEDLITNAVEYENYVMHGRVPE